MRFTCTCVPHPLCMYRGRVRSAATVRRPSPQAQVYVSDSCTICISTADACASSPPDFQGRCHPMAPTDHGWDRAAGARCGIMSPVGMQPIGASLTRDTFQSQKLPQAHRDSPHATRPASVHALSATALSKVRLVDCVSRTLAEASCYVGGIHEKAQRAFRLAEGQVPQW